MAALAIAAVMLAGARAEAQDQEPVPGAPGAMSAADPEPGAPQAPEPGDGARPEKPWNRGVPVETRLRARAIYHEGNEFLNIPLFAQAAEKYQEALALYQHPAIYFNLAIAQLNLVQPVESYHSFSRALEHGPGPLGDEYYQRGREYLERLERQLGRIEVTCAQPGAVVTLDGRPLFTGPGRWQDVVVPGEHQVLASADGFIPATERVVVSAGERIAVTLALRHPDRVDMERRWPAWKPWAVAGAGLAVVAAGAVVDWRASRELDRYNRNAASRCTRTSGCDSPLDTATLRAQRDQAERMRTTARAIYLAGGAVLAGGVVLLYVNRERPVRRSAVEAAPVSLVPMLGPGAAGLSAHIRF